MTKEVKTPSKSATHRAEMVKWFALRRSSVKYAKGNGCSGRDAMKNGSDRIVERMVAAKNAGFYLP